MAHVDIQKFKRDKELEDYKARLTTEIEKERGNYNILSVRLRSGTDYAIQAIRGMLLANGGALLIMFAYLGNVEKSGSLPSHKYLVWSAGLFASGFASGLLTSFFAANANECVIKSMINNERNPFERGNTFRAWAKIWAFLSLATFLGGIFFTMNWMDNLYPEQALLECADSGKHNELGAIFASISSKLGNASNSASSCPAVRRGSRRGGRGPARSRGGGRRL